MIDKVELMTTVPVRLYDTQRSGNAWKVRLLAGFLNCHLERVTLSIDRGDLADPAFLSRSPLRQVPVLELNDGCTIVESSAILFFLARATPWWPTDAIDQANVLTWISFEQAKHMHAIAQLRLHRALHPTRAVDERDLKRWRSQAEEALELLEARLARPDAGDWVATHVNPSIADIALYPYTRLAGMGGLDTARLPHVTRWLVRFEGLPDYQPLFPGRPDLTESTVER